MILKIRSRHLRCQTVNKFQDYLVSARDGEECKWLFPSLYLLSCELSVSMKESPNGEKIHFQEKQENIRARVSMLIKLQVSACSLIQKETLAQVFLVNVAKFLRTFFYRIPLDNWFWTYKSESQFPYLKSCSTDKKLNFILKRQALYPCFKDLHLLLKDITLHKKFSIKVFFSVYVTIPVLSGHIYWRNPSWKTKYF